MRTTITLDEDVAIVIERLRRSRNESLKDIINEALREGLKRLGAPRDKRPPVRTRSVNLGRCLLDNVDDVAEVLAIAESESFR
ncbi:MAG TPA: CopG family transcriptional regulator [Casimicrobiaceae bacterium]|nr:CopG family transcriptional regulator [Casimicrobiaceae bacterium]